MSSRFYKTFGIDRFQIVMVTGIGNREQLITQLSQETFQTGKRALITSDTELSYPPEGQFQIGSDAQMLLKSSMERENVAPLYLAADLKGKQLVPFDNKTLIGLTKQIDRGTVLFMIVESNNKDLLSRFKKNRQSLVICTIDFGPIRGDLLEARMDMVDEESVKDKQILKDIEKLLSSICRSEEWVSEAHHFVLFVNRINDIFDENLFIPVGRHLKQKGLTRIYFGNLHTYQIKSI